MIGRLARIANAGMKASPALKHEAAIGKAIMHERGAQRASIIRDIAPATNLPKGVHGPTLPINAKSYVDSKFPQYQSWGDAYKNAQWLDKAAYHTGRIGGSGARVAGSVLNNPVGQMGLFMGAPMLMMGSEEEPQSSYQDVGMIVPNMIPPDSYQQAYSDVGIPTNPQLDAEQISKARKRAEEQAALNQFYASALSQYGGYQ